MNLVCAHLALCQLRGRRMSSELHVCALCKFVWLVPMRQKARGLAQQGGAPGWLEESDPGGVILHGIDVPYRLSFPYSTVSLTGAAQLRAGGNFQLLLYSIVL